MVPGFVAGVLGVQVLSALPPWPAVGAAALAALLLARHRQIFLAAVCAGACWALAFALFRLSGALPPELEKTDLLIEGVVATIPRVREREMRFEFDVDTVHEPKNAHLPRRIRLSWYHGDAVLKAGERWRLTVRLKRPRGMMNPGGMDYELWLFSRNIRATGYVRERSDNRRIGRASAWFDVESWRQALHDRLSAVLREREFSGILEALVMGDEDGITTAQWDLLRRTGTAHLVAISGSHIALIAGWCFVLARWVASRPGMMRWSPPSAAAVFAFLGALFYSALADFAIPTQRALIMIAIVMGAILGRRHHQGLHTLGLACLAVVVYDPLSVVSAGFWLSYFAVALIWFILAHRLRYPGAIETLWRINWATAVGLAPFLLLFFHQIPLLSPLANLLAVPVIGLVVVPLCLIGSMVIWLSEAASVWIFDATELLLCWTWEILEWLAQPAFVQWNQPQPPVWTIPFALLGACLLLAPRGFPSRWLGWVLFLPALTRTADPLDPGAFELTVLDVGQGSAAVVRTRHHALVFDTGARLSERFDMGSAVIAPFLTDAGIERIDTLVVSHGDNDHNGGTASLLRLMPTGLVYSSVPELLPSNRAIACRAGQDWVWDGVRFAFLSPEDRNGSDNDLSCVLSVSNEQHGALLTGDIERQAETRLVERYGDELSSEILVVPHHGSKTSSTREFLQHVRPRYALISSGYLNRFGFPHPTVLVRLHQVSAAVLNTAHEGAITFRMNAAPVEPEPRSYRREHRHYWNADP